MYVDTVVTELGKAAGRIVYRSDVVIEHLHPIAGKAVWDETYAQTNNPGQYLADRQAYGWWLEHQMDHDVAKVRALVHGTREEKPDG
jgi:hypothetical protein